MLSVDLTSLPHHHGFSSGNIVIFTIVQTLVKVSSRGILLEKAFTRLNAMC